MANKPLKSIKFPGLNDTYTVPEVDATLATTGAAADAKKVGDEISDLKADLSEIEGIVFNDVGTTWQLGILSASGTVNSGNGISSTIITGIDRLSLSNDCNAVLLLYSGNTYLGKVNADGTISKTAGDWKYFTDNIDFLSLFASFNADGLRISVLPTDATVISSDTVQTYANTHCFIMRKDFATNEKVEALSDNTLVSYDMQDIFEKRDPSNYSATTLGNNRVRVKIQYLQRIPKGATKCTISVTAKGLHDNRYRAGFCFYTEEYTQVAGSIRGWLTQGQTAQIDSIDSSAAYFALYYATSSASVITLDEIDHSANSIVFDTSDTNYAKELMYTPVNQISSNLVKTGNKYFVPGYYLSINHRGYNIDVPENTLPAFIMSKKKGFQYVETDLEFTSDDVCVLLHDSTINRTARNADGTTISETTPINSITYEQALEYDFGIWMGTQWAGLKIPTFEEFITLCKQLSIHPVIELKDTANGNVFTEERVTAIASVIKKVGMQNHVSFISFNSNALTRMSVHFPNADYGLGIEGTPRLSEIQQAVTTLGPIKNNNNNVFVSHKYNVTLTDEMYRIMDEANVNQILWTLNDPSAVTLSGFRDSVIGFLSDWLNVGEMLAKRLYASLPN